MISRIVISLVILLLLQSGWTQVDTSLLVRSNEKHFTISIETSLSYYGTSKATVDLFLGAIQSNEYQEVYSVAEEGDGRKQAFGGADSCYYYPLSLQGKRRGRKKTVTQELEIRVFDVHTDFEQIDSLFPYDEQSEAYRNFTGDNLPFINTQNPTLTHIADSLWTESENALDYARKCYEYVPIAFEYLDPITGFHPVDTILEKGGGDCGNLSTVFITLLRIKGIPARHLVGFRPDNSLHVWTDFYLENYGWIPVDVTYKQSDPTGDYFGTILFDNNGFIIHHGIGHVVFGSKGPLRIPSLQTYSYNVNYSIDNVRKVSVIRDISVQAVENR